MDQFRDIQEFISESKRATEVHELVSSLESVVRALGVDYFALIHHVDLANLPVHAVKLDNYPTGWMSRVIERRYFVHDPVHAACKRTPASFFWADVPRFIDVTSMHKEIFEGAAKEGMGDGFTVPIHVPGEYSGSCSFGMRWGRRFDEEVAPA